MFDLKMQPPAVYVDLTAPGEADAGPWRIYASVRDESIAAQQMMQAMVSWAMVAASAVIAGMGFMMQYVKAPNRVQLLGWSIIALIGFLGASEYMTQTGRMMRAGWFARRLEQLLSVANVPLPAEAMWETFLTERGHRLVPGYWLTALATIGLLAAAQFVPFLVYAPADRMLGGSWWALPAAGAAVVFLSAVIQYLIYRHRFPPRGQ